MERLTEWKDGQAWIKKSINGVRGRSNYALNSDIEAVKRLAAYEDTGLTPEEIKTMQEESKKDYSDMCRFLSDCIKLTQENISLKSERDTLKKALELMYTENKEYNPNGMGNVPYYIQQAKEKKYSIYEGFEKKNGFPLTCERCPKKDGCLLDKGSEECKKSYSEAKEALQK